MMTFESTRIEGVYLITLPKFDDNRGSFIKTFHNTEFSNNHISFHLRESYLSISHKNVIRGMHFQNPPHDHEKIVFCPQGKILDVVLDIRKESPTYGQHLSVELSAENHQAIHIPKGCAHGFLSLLDESITYYLVSSEYNKDNDDGILYNSFGMNWNCPQPIMSMRDSEFSSFEQFDSPF